jgi:hypothetical protein
MGRKMKSLGPLLFSALLMGPVGCAVSSRHLATTSLSPPLPPEVAAQTGGPPVPAVSQPSAGCLKLALRDFVQTKIQAARARGATATGLLANPVLFVDRVTERMQNKEGETEQHTAEDPPAVQQPQTLNWTRTLRVMRGLTSMALGVVGGPVVVPLGVVQAVVRHSRESVPQEALSWRVLRVGLGVAGVFGPGDVLVEVLDAYERQRRLGCQEKSPLPAADQGEPLPLVTFTRAVSQPHFIKLDGTF